MNDRLFLIVFRIFFAMNLSLPTISYGVGEWIENQPPAKVIKTEESQEHQEGANDDFLNDPILLESLNSFSEPSNKSFPLLSLIPSLFKDVVQFLTPHEALQLSQVSKDCLRLVGCQLNLELSLENKFLTKKDFLRFFGEHGMYREIQCLSLSYSSFHPVWLRNLPKTIKTLKLSSVKTNFYRKYRFKDKNTMLTEMVEVVRETLPKLKFLNISNNSLGDTGAQQIGRINSLKYLNISGNALRAAGAAEIAKLPSLRYLSISRNDLKEAGSEQIGKLTSLESLDISMNNLSAAGARQIGKMKSLKYLNISGNDLGPAGAEPIGKLTSLESLDISMNNLRASGAAEIAMLPSLRFLSISRNDLKESGAEQIGKLTSLESLDISMNNLGGAGAEQVGKLTSLKSLDISGNRLGSVGAEYISKLTSLKFLDVSINNLGSAEAITHISKITSLRSLLIFGNYLKDLRKQELQENLPFCQIKFKNSD